MVWRWCGPACTLFLSTLLRRGAAPDAAPWPAVAHGRLILHAVPELATIAAAGALQKEAHSEATRGSTGEHATPGGGSVRRGRGCPSGCSGGPSAGARGSRRDAAPGRLHARVFGPGRQRRRPDEEAAPTQALRPVVVRTALSEGGLLQRRRGALRRRRRARARVLAAPAGDRRAIPKTRHADDVRARGHRRRQRHRLLRGRTPDGPYP